MDFILLSMGRKNENIKISLKWFLINWNSWIKYEIMEI
jgi:hypothetical protein